MVAHCSAKKMKPQRLNNVPKVTQQKEAVLKHSQIYPTIKAAFLTTALGR